MDFSEKRKAERLPVRLSIGISELFRQDNEFIKNVNAPIEVIDISRRGMGFLSESELPIGYYFNSRIQIGNDENSVFYSVIKIIRCKEEQGGRKLYGCELVGFPSVLNYIFEDLEEKYAKEK